MRTPKGNLSTTYEIHEDLKVMFDIAGVNLSKVYIAGGALVNPGNPNDIDLYVEDNDTKQEVKRVLSRLGNESSTEHAHTYIIHKYACPIQLITKLQGKPEEVMSQFDFVQNGRSLDFKGIPKNLTGSQENRLKLNDNVKTPMTLMNRLMKMLGKNYTIEVSEVKKLLKMVEMSLPPDDWNLSKKDLGSFYGGNDK